MRTTQRLGVFAIWIVLLATSYPASASVSYGNLTEGQTIAQFRTEAIYLNADSKAIGARFRHIPSGFVLDLLGIQSVPQAFMWVNSVPPSDQGEPHTCEHLLLGKGNKGRYVASLENMSMGQSTAYTMQLQTCYQLNTSAGAPVFFNLFKEQLDALIHPNYSDEEIRREVCNMGIRLDPSDSALHLEEKGTVYNEMVSSFEGPWGELYFRLGRLVYGMGHPLSLNAGGYPDSIRNMVPADLRRFHDRAYHLNNMGAIVALPDDVPLDEALKQFTDILAKIEPQAAQGDDPAHVGDRLPPLNPAAPGTVVVTPYQSQDLREPGQIVFAWPAQLKMAPRERYLMELFMANLAGDETSVLYRDLIDTKTRIINTGAAGVSGWVSSDPGYGAYVSLYNIDRTFLTAPMIDSLRRVIEREFQAVAHYPAGSPEFAAFSNQLRSRMIERKRGLRVFLNQPPRFGYRNTGAEWFYSLQRASDEGGFRRSLLFDPEFSYVDSLLSSGDNFWPGYLDKWKLSVDPYVSAAVSDTTLLAVSETARKGRILRFTDSLKQAYKVTSDAAALTGFKKDYDAKTAEIEDAAKQIPMPGFIANPPLSLDPSIRYRTEQLAGVVPAVVSTFDNLGGGTVGFAFDAHVIPESLLVYLPALPALLTSVGATRDGKLLTYVEMREALRRDLLSLDIYFSTNYRTQRVELVARGSGSNLPETESALSWMRTVLHDADLRPENLDRIRDAIDQSLAGCRNRRQGSEESWVDEPALAYWRQSNHLLATADCFLTQLHSFHRLRWLLREPANPESARQFSDLITSLTQASFLEALRSSGNGNIRPGLGKCLDSLDAKFSSSSNPDIKDAITDLRRSLPDIADQSLADDWNYLCRQMLHDYRTPARTALDQLRHTLSLLLDKKNARGFVIASAEMQKQLSAGIAQIVNGLSDQPVAKEPYDQTPTILASLRRRFPNLTTPLFVGLIDDNKRSGVHYNTADCASYLDTNSETLLSFLSARLYGGGGAHSMFMKTWGAGLAYSNGLRSNESTGRIIYYAERCPDLAQTMQFVVNELKHAPHDSTLGQYAIAQAFAGSRAASNYEARGEAMAADLEDGVGPDIVSRFRRKILTLGKEPGFYDRIQDRMKSQYGLVLPGYGPSAAESMKSADANYFVIGPEAQMQSYEKYLQQVEPGAVLYRIYPGDYWLRLKL